MSEVNTSLDIFNNPADITADLEKLPTAEENYEEASKPQAGNPKSLTHDKLYEATKGFIKSAVQSKSTYVIIPFSQFTPHTESDINLLLGVNNEERTSFDASQGRWDEMFKNTFATLGYEYEWCYYRGEHLPYGVMVSWDDGVDTEDENLQMAREKYPQFTYPKYYYFLPTANEVRDSYKNESSNLQLTDVLDQTFALLNTLVNGAIATNKKYVQVLWTDINKVNPDYVKAQFYTEKNTPKIHAWSSDDTIATYSTRLSNETIVSIHKGNDGDLDTATQFSIHELLTLANKGHGYNYYPIYDTKNQPLGFILSWHETSDTETEKTIESILASYSTTPEGTDEVLILPVFHYADQVLHKSDIRKNMRSSYIKAFADKIQSKLTAAFNKSENSIAILWTEISSSNFDSVKKEWDYEGYFSKKLETKPYNDDSDVNSIDANTKATIFGALATLEICKQIGSDSGNTESRVYWDYLHYKDIADKVAETADKPEAEQVQFTKSNSCGITLAYGKHDGAQTAIGKVQKKYRETEDPAKKSNNS